jgi:hypothetical protein
MRIQKSLPEVLGRQVRVDAVVLGRHIGHIDGLKPSFSFDVSVS